MAQQELPTYELSGTTMGTTFNILLVAPPSEVDLDGLQLAVVDKLEQLENIASAYRPQSDVSRFNANPSTDWIPVAHELCTMITDALDISDATDGAFDITVGPLVNLWGFGPADMTNELPAEKDIELARASVGKGKLTADCDRPALKKTVAGLTIDLSAWAKGFAVDEVAALLDDANLNNYLVEIGGELRMQGYNAEQQAFTIAIEKPLSNGMTEYEAISLSNVAVATSGDYRNYYDHDGRRYSHAIDPRTGRPIDHSLTGVTVISASTAYADGMATALLVLGPDDGMALAEQLSLACYFLIRTDEGLEEAHSTQFELIVSNNLVD